MKYIEKTFLEVIEKNYDPDMETLSEKSAASELAGMMEKFAQWLKADSCYWFNYCLNKWGLYDKNVEFDEIFQFWYKNVYKK